MDYQIKPAGDQAVLVKLGESIDDATNASVRQLARVIETNKGLGFGEVILGYNSLLVSYNPLVLSYDDVVSMLKHLEKETDEQDTPKSRIVEIPTVYGDEWGPDLNDVAAYHNLSPEEVVSIHSGSTYLVYFMGFTPGFPFFGGMSEKIATPRLASPRVSIPAGSVGIANNQTGIYPVSSPGGWRLIGRTPLQFYNPEREQPFLLNPGDYVKFKPINRDQFETIKAKVESGEYEPVIIR